MRHKLLAFPMLLAMLVFTTRCSSAPKESNSQLTSLNFEISEVFVLEDDKEIIWTLEKTKYDGISNDDNIKSKFVPDGKTVEN